MFFNHPLEPPEPRKPTAVYARVNSIEPIGGDDDVLLLDCVDADWVDVERSEGPPPGLSCGGSCQLAIQYWL